MYPGGPSRTAGQPAELCVQRLDQISSATMRRLQLYLAGLMAKQRHLFLSSLKRAAECKPFKGVAKLKPSGSLVGTYT